MWDVALYPSANKKTFGFVSGQISLKDMYKQNCEFLEYAFVSQAVMMFLLNIPQLKVSLLCCSI